MQELISKAFTIARRRRHEAPSIGDLHRKMSQSFVECLADELVDRYQDRANVTVMARHIGGNRQEFGMSELMFDVVAFEWDRVISSAQRKPLSYVTRGLLAVESELAKDTRAALFDFNKLVLADAERKLFVGPLVDDNRAYREVLRAAAEHCLGQLQLAQIPHPEAWKEHGPESIRVWDWEQGDWR